MFDPVGGLSVTGSVSLPNSFGVESLFAPDGSMIDWGLIETGTYTLLSTTSMFDQITNFGPTKARPIDAGRSAYFQNGSLQLVIVPEPTALALAGLRIAAAA